MMYKIIRTWALAVVICITTVCFGQQQGGYVVSGTISGLADNTVLQLTPVSHDREAPIAETTVREGKFSFTGRREFPLMVRLSVKDKGGNGIFMLENAPIVINAKAETKTPNGQDAPRVNFSSFAVSGSPLTKKLQGYQARRDSLDVLYAAYHKKYAEGERIMTEARNTKDPEKIKAAQETEAWKAFENAEHDFFKTVEDTFLSIILENKDTYWGPMMAIYLYSYFTAEQDELFNSFPLEVQQSYYGEKMRDEVFPGGQTGGPVKPFTVKNDDGKVLTLKQLSEGKKVVLIDFWASWCAPCRKEIPNVKALYAKYKDQGLQVISISIDEKEAAWRKALSEEKLEWPNFRDTDGATGPAALYKVRSIPAMFLVDAESQTLIAAGDNARGSALAKKLAELFEK